jgi:hypothetical protein
MLTEIDDPAAALLAARYGASAPDVRLRWNSVVETLLNHRSVRAYRPDLFSPGIWWSGLRMKRLGSSAHALQMNS